jgi:DNA-binding transcriptional regulator YiaG
MTSAELRSIRKRFGLTQSAWGAYLGIGKEYVSQIENGVRVPSATLVALIRCYDRNGLPTLPPKDHPHE